MAATALPGLVNPKVPQVGTIRGLMSNGQVANSFVVRDGPSTYLIDAGLPGNARVIEGTFRAAGLPLSAISYILLTHQHPDHMGGAAYIRWLTHARVACHEMDAPAVEGRGPRLSPLFVRLLFHPHPVQVDRPLKDGDTIGPFTVVHTPGHTLGSASYYHAEKKILFLGDAAVTTSRGIRLSRPYSNFDPDTAIESLEKLSKLDVRVIYSGHGPAILSDGSALLKEAASQLSKFTIPKHWTLIGPEGMAETHPHLEPSEGPEPT